MSDKKTVCEGTGTVAVHVEGLTSLYPHCGVCGREFSAQGRKSMIRFENAWHAIPKHYRTVASNANLSAIRPCARCNSGLWHDHCISEGCGLNHG